MLNTLSNSVYCFLHTLQIGDVILSSEAFSRSDHKESKILLDRGQKWSVLCFNFSTKTLTTVQTVETPAFICAAQHSVWYCCCEYLCRPIKESLNDRIDKQVINGIAIQKNSHPHSCFCLYYYSSLMSFFGPVFVPVAGCIASSTPGLIWSELRPPLSDELGAVFCAQQQIIPKREGPLVVPKTWNNFCLNL